MTKSALINRELCVRRIADIYKSANKAESSPQHKSVFIASYSSVALIAQDFELAHLKLIQKPNADFDAEDPIRAKFNRIHYQIKTMIHQLDEPRVGALGANTHASASKIKFPKISLPHFSGDLALWLSFFALYNTSIHNNPQLADIEKFQYYLLSSLNGDALI